MKAAGHLVSPIAMAIACGLIWLGYDNLNLLQGTVFWELRYLVLGCLAFALLSLAEFIAARVTAIGQAEGG
jgi:predicted ferric reductase